jgi:hypothetical protein
MRMFLSTDMSLVSLARCERQSRLYFISGVQQRIAANGTCLQLEAVGLSVRLSCSVWYVWLLNFVVEMPVEMMYVKVLCAVLASVLGLLKATPHGGNH